jgi:hypothetical protein
MTEKATAVMAKKTSASLLRSERRRGRRLAASAGLGPVRADSIIMSP